MERLLEIAKQAAVEAGKAVLKIYDSGDFKSYQKDDDSPVTSADFEANEIICRILQSETPDIPIMSEESKHELLSARKNWSRYWLIDPIDGTQEFIARSGDFAVNIALVENNQPVIGVIYWPTGETLYFAQKNKGAYKLSPSENKRIRVRKLEDPAEGVLMIAISRRQSREGVMSRMNGERTYQTVPMGSCSLKSCTIAEGKADVFMRLGVTGEWDTGASQCIVSEAGGKILSAAELEPLTYNERESVENPNFVVLGDQNVDWRNIVQYKLGNNK